MREMTIGRLTDARNPGRIGRAMKRVSQRTVLVTLIRARAAIERPEHWCRGEFARTRSGASVEPDSPGAYALCALGALYKATAEYPRAGADIRAAARAVLAAPLAPAPYALSEFNDRSDHAGVLALYDAAIRRARRAVRRKQLRAARS